MKLPSRRRFILLSLVALMVLPLVADFGIALHQDDFHSTTRDIVGAGPFSELAFQWVDLVFFVVFLAVVLCAMVVASTRRKVVAAWTLLWCMAGMSVFLSLLLVGKYAITLGEAAPPWAESLARAGVGEW